MSVTRLRAACGPVSPWQLRSELLDVQPQVWCRLHVPPTILMRACHVPMKQRDERRVRLEEAQVEALMTTDRRISGQSRHKTVSPLDGWRHVRDAP